MGLSVRTFSTLRRGRFSGHPRARYVPGDGSPRAPGTFSDRVDCFRRTDGDR